MFVKEEFERVKSMASIQQMHPSDFEYFCKFLFDHCGYQSVMVTKKHGDRQADRGIDIEMQKDGEKIYVQCKKWFHGFGEGNVLPVHVIRELGGCMLRDGVKHGLIITTLPFDEYGSSEAQKMQIAIWGREEIYNRMTDLDPGFDKPPIIDVPEFRLQKIILVIVGLFLLISMAAVIAFIFSR